MKPKEPIIVSVELPLEHWVFLKTVLSSLKHSVEQPPVKGRHESHVARLARATPDGWHMLQDTIYTIEQTLIVEGPTEHVEEWGSVHPPIETTFPEVKSE